MAWNVIKEICDELRFFFHALPHVIVTTIYIGGGTPSCLDPDLFEHLLKVINSCLRNIVKEWTVEVNPESLNKNFIMLCKKYYVTRLSIGIQSTDDSLLDVLGRRTSTFDIKKAAELLSCYWDGKVSIDLITEIPGQTSDAVQRDITFSLDAFHPQHVSLYSLTIEKGTELEKQIREKKLVLPSREFRESLWFEGYRILESKGFFNYEISNFAQQGNEALHNIHYWLMNPYIGIGPGAVSTLPGHLNKNYNRDSTNEGTTPVIRISHPGDLHLYCTGKKMYWGMMYDVIAARTFLFEICMMGFRLKSGIPKQKFISRFGKALPDFIPDIWVKWEKAGWIQPDQSAYILTKKGRFLLNTLLTELSDYIER